LYADIKRFEDRERESISDFIPGSIYKVMLDDSHPLAFGYPGYYFTLKQNSDLYEFMKDGWNVGVIKKDNQVAGFVGSRLKDKLKDGTVIGVQDLGREQLFTLLMIQYSGAFGRMGSCCLQMQCSS